LTATPEHASLYTNSRHIAFLAARWPARALERGQQNQKKEIASHYLLEDNFFHRRRRTILHRSGVLP
jgi:hypothetical protein